MDMDIPGNDTFLERWEQLHSTQKRYVMSRQHHRTMAAAAEDVGISPSTAYNWGDIVEDLVGAVADYRAAIVRDRLEEAAVQAAETMVDLLDSGADTVRAQAAQYIIDQATGKATQHVQQETTQLQSIEVEIIDNGAKE